LLEIDDRGQLLGRDSRVRHDFVWGLQQAQALKENPSVRAEAEETLLQYYEPYVTAVQFCFNNKPKWRVLPIDLPEISLNSTDWLLPLLSWLGFIQPHRGVCELLQS
jgi:hypothetical protein